MSAPLTKAQVDAITPADVHKTIGRVMLADGFDFVVDFEVPFFFSIAKRICTKNVYIELEITWKLAPRLTHERGAT